jgi:4-amino-4-deoxy-L-arabinose transferase-like glycosyltransferase
MSLVVLDERPTWQEVVFSFVPPAKRTTRATALLARVPMALILGAQALLTWRLSDIANDDEALYIDAGHDLLHHLATGSPVAEYGSYLSGVPFGYPVVAAVLDSFGGLALVRLFSVACLLICTLCVQRTAQHLFDRRTGLLAALVFAVSGSVLFIGKLATYDAPCIALVAVAVMLAVTKGSFLSGFAIGVLLALAAATKYAGAAFIPFVLVLIVLSEGWTGLRGIVRPMTRAGIVAVTTVGLLLGGYRLWGASIHQGLSFTTTSRKALDYQPTTVLVRSVVDDVGLLFALALVGVVILVSRRAIRQALLSLTCLGAALFLPLSQIRIHEFTSLDKHTAFSALFFALPAAVTLDAVFTRKGAIKALGAVLLWLLLIDGLWRSDLQYSWPSSVTRTLSAVEASPVAGEYVSADGDSLRYYTTSNSGIRWEPSAFAYSLFGQGTPVVLSAIQSDRFAGFVYQTGNVPLPVHQTQVAMTQYLARDPNYRLVIKFRVSPYEKAEWYVWQRASHR